AVPLRAGQAGVYDARYLRPPNGRIDSHLAQDATPHFSVANHTARRLAPPGLELRLHQRDRLPARRRQRQRRRQRLAHAHERDVSDDEPWGERQLPRLAHVRPLQHGDAWVVADAWMQLSVADVEGDYA